MKKKAILMLLAATVVMNTMAGCTPSEQPSKAENVQEEQKEADTEAVTVTSAFSRKPQIIVLDEPTNHLDVGYQFQIMDLMKAQKESTVFSSIHDMNIAMQYCDYILALKNGEIVSYGTPEKVLTEALLRDLFSVRTEMIEMENGHSHIRYLGAIHA